jgi:hypothetical protein
MNLCDIAKKGLKKLEYGEVGINIDAITKEDAEYLKNYFGSKGYNAEVENLESKEGQRTIYPVNVVGQMLIGVKNA